MLDTQRYSFPEYLREVIPRLLGYCVDEIELPKEIRGYLLGDTIVR